MSIALFGNALAALQCKLNGNWHYTEKNDIHVSHVCVTTLKVFSRWDRIWDNWPHIHVILLNKQ